MQTKDVSFILLMCARWGWCRAYQRETRIMVIGGNERRDGMGYSFGFCLSFLFRSSQREKARIPSHIAHGRIMGKMYVTAALNR